MPSETAELIGRKIRQAREGHGLRLERLAADLEISRDTLERYERGQTEPSYVRVLQIARLLDKPIDWFADGTS